MPGTVPNWRSTNLVITAAQFWGQLAIPGNGARLTLHTDGTPESLANPSAFHYGHTKDGLKARIKASYTEHYADELSTPLVSVLDKVEMAIAGALLGITDMNLVKNLLAGVGTYSTNGDVQYVTIGERSIVYQSVALIWPLFVDPSLFGVFNIYSTFNKSGIEFDVGRTKMSDMPMEFMGHGIPSRAATDRTGNYWAQIA